MRNQRRARGFVYIIGRLDYGLNKTRLPAQARTDHLKVARENMEYHSRVSTRIGSSSDRRPIVDFGDVGVRSCDARGQVLRRAKRTAQDLTPTSTQCSLVGGDATVARMNCATVVAAGGS